MMDTAALCAEYVHYGMEAVRAFATREGVSFESLTSVRPSYMLEIMRQHGGGWDASIYEAALSRWKALGCPSLQ